MANSLENACHSVNLVGWESLTFKEMFETAVGYQILTSEPQQFCDSCARMLIAWHEFKSLCQKTQESLLVIEPIKTEPDEPHSETVWYGDNNEKLSLKFEPDLTMKIEAEEITTVPIPTPSLDYGDGDFITVQFKVLVRYFGLQLTKIQTLNEIVTVEGTTLDEIMHQIWLHVKHHLKREIIFDDDENKPYWHEDEYPQEKDIDRFILFQDSIARRTYEAPNLSRFKSWTNKQPTLFIYPYSKNLQSQLQWKIAEAALIDQDPMAVESLIKKYMQIKKTKEIFHVATEPVQVVIKDPVDVCIPNDCSNYPIIATFSAHIRFFKGQNISKTFQGNYTVAGNDIIEFLHNLWLAVKPHIIREIVFTDNEQPTWHPREFPCEDDLTKFVEFHDKTSKKNYRTETLSEYILKSWKDKKVLLYISPYSNIMKTKFMWENGKSLLNSPGALPEKQVFDSVSDSAQVITTLTEQLKKTHGLKFPTAKESDWRMWAFYIDCFTADKHERLINQSPPTQLLPFFDVQLNQIPITGPNDSEYSINLLARIKEAKCQQTFVFVGQFTFKGNTVNEIKHSIWEAVRPYLIREVIFDKKNDVEEWDAAKETPTEEDLHKFVTIYDPKLKVVYKLESTYGRTLTQANLERWNKTPNLVLNIFPFTTSVSTMERLQNLKKTFFDWNSVSWKATEKLIDRLKNIHSKKLISNDYNWRTWAHYIQGQENKILINQSPPSELSHLFVSVSLQDTYKNFIDECLNDESNKVTKCRIQDVFDLMQLTKEDVNDKTTLKQCPFTGCSSVVQISNLLEHSKRCRYNPNLKLNYHCRHTGCKKLYANKSDYTTHLLRCRFNADRQRKPTHQCPHCPALITNLTNHILAKHSTRQFVCDACGATKGTKAMLQQHIMAGESLFY